MNNEIKEEKDTGYLTGRTIGAIVLIGVAAVMPMCIDNLYHGRLTRMGEKFKKEHPNILTLFYSNDTNAVKDTSRSRVDTSSVKSLTPQDVYKKK